MRPTAEEKERFLQYIREGDDRPTAAWRINPDFTGTMFKRMCNPSSKRYEPDFSAAYDEAVEDRGPLDPDRPQIWSGERSSSSTTLAGYTKANHLTHDQLEHFLEMVRDGVMAHSAAKRIEPPTSFVQIQRRASRDADFAEAFREAKEEGFPAYQESLRAEAVRQAFAGDYRALKDQMLMHLPEAKALMTTKHEVSGLDGNAIELARKYFPELPPEMLDEMIRVLEAQEPKQIGPSE
jgi:hypothetical protein